MNFEFATKVQKNLHMLTMIATQLGDLLDDLVFVGGCTTALLITDSGTPDVRYTMDVDCIVDVLTLSDYHAVESALSHKGFEQSLSEESHICRWRYAGFLLDFCWM